MFKPLISLLCIVIILASVIAGTFAWLTPIGEADATVLWTVRIAACLLGPTGLFVLVLLIRSEQQNDVGTANTTYTKYDDISWHDTGEYPNDLPPENVATHIGVFFAWIIERNLVRSAQEADFPDDFANIRKRNMTGLEFLLQSRDGKLVSSDLNDTGNAFAAEYYPQQYLLDWAEVFIDDDEMLYHVEDTWHNYDRIKPVLDKTFDDWMAKKMS